MKTWFKILTGKATSTSAEITGQIEKLRAEQAEVKEKLLQSMDALDKARIEIYGGQGKQADVDVLQSDVAAFQIQVDTLERALSGLETKRREAVDRERRNKVDGIDKRIEELRHLMQEARREYVMHAVLIAEYKKLLMGPALSVGMPSREAIELTGSERAEYADEAERIRQTYGSTSIIAEIMSLREQRAALVR